MTYKQRILKNKLIEAIVASSKILKIKEDATSHKDKDLEIVIGELIYSLVIVQEKEKLDKEKIIKTVETRLKKAF